MNTAKLVRIALIAALYAVITLAFAPISYGLVQVRVAEAMTVLPFITPLAIPGLFIGCFIANIFGGLGVYDIVLGSLATLIAAYLTSRLRRPYLAPLPPVIVNALIVGGYLSFLINTPFWTAALYVGAGELVACYVLGLPLLKFLREREEITAFLRGEKSGNLEEKGG